MKTIIIRIKALFGLIWTGLILVFLVMIFPLAFFWYKLTGKLNPNETLKGWWNRIYQELSGLWS